MHEEDNLKARRRAAARKSFFNHLIIYAAVNAVVALVNLITTPNKLWFYYVGLIWGIGIVFHAYDVYKQPTKNSGKIG